MVQGGCKGKARLIILRLSRETASWPVRVRRDETGDTGVHCEIVRLHAARSEAILNHPMQGCLRPARCHATRAAYSASQRTTKSRTSYTDTASVRPQRKARVSAAFQGHVSGTSHRAPPRVSPNVQAH